jgi:fumarylacetoacetate (FAA) hydrolase
VKIANFLIPGSEISALGVTVGEWVYDIRVAWAIGNLEVAISNSLTETLCLNLATGALGDLNRALVAMDPAEVPEGRYSVDEIQLLAPIQPRSFRDFYAFEAHVKNARAKRGLPMIPEWYEAPVFYFSNTSSVAGPNARIRKPPETNELDYELELAVVIGKEGGDIPVAEADEYIAGFTILNDWSARDIQRREMKVGLGPAKSKDFATTIGPYLVTPDELADRMLADKSRGARYDLVMIARVNGQEYSCGNSKDMNWTFAELISAASKNTTLKPGDLIGSGTVGTGCITEFAEGTFPWLQPGDQIELEIDELGVLANEVI